MNTVTKRVEWEVMVYHYGKWENFDTCETLERAEKRLKAAERQHHWEFASIFRVSITERRTIVTTKKKGGR